MQLPPPPLPILLPPSPSPRPQCFFKRYNELVVSHPQLVFDEGDVADRITQFKETTIWPHVVQQVRTHRAAWWRVGGTSLAQVPCICLEWCGCCLLFGAVESCCAVPSLVLQILSSRAYEHWTAAQLSAYALRMSPSGYEEGSASKRPRL